VTVVVFRREPTVIREQGWSALRAAYAGWSEDDLRQLLEESSWIYDFEAFTQLRIRARAGRFVTIDPAGFRHGANQAPWPPRPESIPVFVYGGSNALGSGLPDAETIPSRLQDLLRQVDERIAVYNFGRSYYYSTQERVLFEQHLLHGHRPHVAVFLDGLNEFVYPDDEPQWTGALRNMVSTRHQAMVQPVQGLASMLRWFLRTVMRRSGVRPVTVAGPSASPPGVDVADRVIDRWILNRRFVEVLSAAFGVRPLFVWQPVPLHAYDLSLHGFVKSPDGFGPFLPTAAGYEAMARRRAAGEPGTDMLWLADMQQGASANLYVDNVHYNAAFSAAIAGRISEALQQRELLVRR
jgi:hypothetical protein